MINWLKEILNFPLLVKDLTELAQRKQTYVLRFVYAGLLFFIGLLMIGDRYGSGVQNLSRVMGMGWRLFGEIGGLQFFGIYFFVPVMVAGVITTEKERDALPLLILTGMSPTRILIEKVASRLVVFGVLMMLIMPLFSVVYGFGGMSSEMIWQGVYLMILTVLQCAAISLMVSAWCYTTVGALILSYIMVGVITFFPMILLLGYMVCGYVFTGFDDSFMRDFRPDEDLFIGMFFPVYWFFEGVAGWRGGIGSYALFMATLPAWGTVIVSFVMARVVFMRRAFGKPGNVIGSILKVYDYTLGGVLRLVGKKGAKVGGGELPDVRPVRWRELRTKFIGQRRYVVLMLIVLLVPTMLWGYFVVGEVVDLLNEPDANKLNNNRWRVRNWDEMNSVWILFYMGGVILIMTILSSVTFARERTKQTLEVLLTSPMGTHEMLKEKMAVLTRFYWLFFVPYVVLVCVSWWIKSEYYSLWVRDENNPFYYVIAIASYLVFLQIVMWIGMIFSMKVKTATKAVMFSMGTVIAWLAGSVLLIILCFEYTNIRPRDGATIILSISPAFVVVSNEVRELTRLWSSGVVHTILTFMIGGGMWYGLRWFAYSRADGYLGRAEGMVVRADEEVDVFLDGDSLETVERVMEMEDEFENRGD